MCCTVKTCCFITGLRRGTLIVAVFSLLGNVGLLAFMSLATYQSWMSLQYNNFSEIFAMKVIVSPVIIAAIVIDIVLFIGAVNHRCDVLQRWQRGHAFVIGFYLCYFLVLSTYHLTHGLILYGTMNLLAIALAEVVTVYLWIVVRSYEQELHKNKWREMSSGHGDFPAKRLLGPDVEACPVVVSYSQSKVDS